MSFKIAVLGGGPGGYVAAIRAAQLGAKVCLIEKDEVGGTCLNRGCIPTKALVAGAETLRKVKEAADFGINTGEVTIDLARLMERKNQVVERLVKGIHFLIKKNKITYIKGEGRLTAANRIEVKQVDGETQEVLAENIVVATGSEPALIASLGYDGETVITSNEALKLETVPESIIVIGAGVVGCEFACILAEMGSKVTVVDVAPSVLPMTDKDVSRFMQMVFKKRGITVKTKVKVEEVIKGEGNVTARLDSGEELTAQKMLISVGRILNTKGIGLEEAGVALGSRGEVIVDDQMATNVTGIYAIGDVTNRMQLAHVASAQGIVAVENIMGKVSGIDYNAIPSCIFTLPEIGSVGLTSQEAEEKGIAANSGKFSFLALGKAHAMGETEGFVKILADPETDRVLGVHIVGPHASDLIHEGALAIARGITAAELGTTVHAHPTLAEAVMEAAEAVHNKSVHM